MVQIIHVTIHHRYDTLYPRLTSKDKERELNMNKKILRLFIKKGNPFQPLTSATAGKDSVECSHSGAD
jgi:hypothetical protein